MSICCYSVKHTLKEQSFNDLINGYDIYLLKKRFGKNIIFSSYTQCKKHCIGEGNNICHLHSKMNHKNLIKMEDLIKYASKPSKHDEYYHEYYYEHILKLNQLNE